MFNPIRFVRGGILMVNSRLAERRMRSTPPGEATRRTEEHSFSAEEQEEILQRLNDYLYAAEMLEGAATRLCGLFYLPKIIREALKWTSPENRFLVTLVIVYKFFGQRSQRTADR